MGTSVRLWCDEPDLRARIAEALDSTRVQPGEPLEDPPPDALAHLLLEGTGRVFVVREATPATLRFALMAESEMATGLVAEADLEGRLAPTLAAVAAGQVTVPAAAVAAARRPLLTNREKQVLALVVLGLGNREIGGRLHLSESTVKSHLFSSYRKLGVGSRAEATRLIIDRDAGAGLGILQISEAQN